MSLASNRVVKSLIECTGGISAFFGVICLLIGWIRFKDARDFVFALLLDGEITSDWVAAAFLLAGFLLISVAAWSGVLPSHSETGNQDQ